MDFEKDDFVVSIPAQVNGGIKLFGMSIDSAPFSIKRFLRLEWLLVIGYSVGDRDIGPAVISFKARYAFSGALQVPNVFGIWVVPIFTVWLRDTSVVLRLIIGNSMKCYW